MLQSHSIFAVGALLLSFSALVGCAAETTEEGAASDQALVTREAASRATFKLYDEPSHTPDATCDVFTQLTLTTSVFGTGSAELTERVDGVCKPGLDDTTRRYNLTASADDCGSHIYEGTAKVNGQVRAITITDHRSRICRDHVPAMILVDERAAKTEMVQSLFSYDGE